MLILSLLFFISVPRGLRLPRTLQDLVGAPSPSPTVSGPVTRSMTAAAAAAAATAATTAAAAAAAAETPRGRPQDVESGL